MSIFQAIILGIVQGITEFLPVSSTGHLILFPYLLGWKAQSLSYDVALHLGTLLAIVFFFFSDWKNLIRAFINDFQKHTFSLGKYSPKGQFLLLIIIGCLPAAIAGFALNDLVEEKLYSPIVVVISLILVAVLMWWADKKAKGEKNTKKLNLIDCIWIGFFQAVALIPGVSRSGSTIIGGILRGLSREEAARFSFLLSTPIIIGVGVFEFLRLFKNHFIGLDFLPVAIGFLTSAIFGFLTIKYFLKFLQKRNLRIFVYYRVILGLIILWMILLRS